jgi:hypothetical protein
MVPGSAVRRRTAAPLVVLSCPPLFLLYREAGACGSALGCSTAAMAGYALVALAALPAAGALARAVVTGVLPGWVAPHADDPTLATLAGLVVAVDAYLLASLAGVVPAAADAVLAPAGLVLALPLAAVQVATVAAGNALVEPPAAVALGAVAVGVALSAAWWYALAAAAGRAASAVADHRA